MIKLTITEKGGEPRSLTFDKDEISIGRVSGNDVVLPKGNISKRHSRLNFRDGTLELTDLKSTNGTYVNGRKIAEPIVVAVTDRIQVGDFVITMEDDVGAARHDGASTGSAARALPVPPPPPPPRSGSGLSGLPALPSNGTAGEEDDDAGYGMRSRSGRIPIPPPPPPPRRGTAPTSPLGLEDDGVDIGGDMAPPSLSDVAPAGEETGHGGPALFEGGRETAYDDASRPIDQDALGDGGQDGDDLGVSLPPEPGSPTHMADLSMTGRADDADEILDEQGAAEGGVDEAQAADAPLEPLDALLADATVTQIIITGPTTTLVERHGKLEALTLDGGLGDPEAVAEALWRLANTATPPPAPDNPVVDVRLADGTRIAAVFPPASLTGVCGSIRKPVLPDQSLADMAAAGGLAKEAQSILETAIASQRNLLVTGDAGSVGALVGAIAAAIPTSRRVVSLGAALPQPREGWVELALVGDLPGLVRVAAALRADHLVVGEVIGIEVLDILLAAAHGQEGILLGVTARSSTEALTRIEALAAQIPGTAGVAALANSTLDLVIHAAAPTDGGVRVVEITEVKLDAGGRLTADPVLSWRSEGSRRSATGKMQVLGISSRLASAMASSGSSLPANLIRK